MATNFEKLGKAMSQPMLYPRCLASLNGMQHRASLEDQLQRRSSELFCEEMPSSPRQPRPAVDFLELQNNDDDYEESRIAHAAHMNDHLRVPMAQRGHEPMQRYIFINAPNARKPMRISKEMFLQILTCHHTMPTFLEYVFPFGKQDVDRDLLLMGFRSESRIFKASRRFPIEEIGRSGRLIELCYSLKSVERHLTESDPSSTDFVHPAQSWSIRQCSVHHSFDLETDRSKWIVVKGNTVIRDAFRECVAEDINGKLRPIAGFSSPFAVSLALHRTLATWASENWHWFVSDLESFLQDKTKNARAASWDVQLFPSVATLAQDQEPPSRMSRKQRTMSWFKEKRKFSFSTYSSDATAVTSRTNTLNYTTSPTTYEPTGFDEFSFRDLQHVQWVEEKANEILTILQANSKILQDLSNEYSNLSSFWTDDEFTMGQQKAWEPEIRAFKQNIASIDQDLMMQQARVQSLLRLVADRKTLLNGILQYRSMEASRLYAEKSQLSADRIEDVTNKMHFIALKTQRDTVSMRIITVVTLLFLPGTFISTLMSTPIVHFDKTSVNFTMKNIGFGALKLYLIVSLPLMVITLGFWGVSLLWEKYRERKGRSKRNKDSEEMLSGNEKGLGITTTEDPE